MADSSGWKSTDPYVDPCDTSWMHNASFDAYYRENLKDVMRDEGDWDAFNAAARTPLPITFRVVVTSMFADRVREKLFGYWQEVFGKDGLKIHSDDWAEAHHGADGGMERPTRKPARFVEDVVKAPSPLSWYPGHGNAWYLSASRRGLRKAAELREFHEFVKAEDAAGNVSRQEAVSMIPVLLLQVEPHHNVLDMCAAPGSKTQQILENLYVHGTAKNPSDAWSAGMMIANDSDEKRCNLLSHRTQKIHCPNLVVTNLDASQFPTLSSTGAPGGPPLLFDRILCDVPCSGDGTLRKAPDLWRSWSASGGNGLHRLQIQIAMRGLALLKVGGLLVYSTCSFNPVENEAVVCELIRQYGADSVEIVDSSAVLPGLITRPGIREWKVRTEKDQVGLDGWGEYDAVKDRMNKKGEGVYSPSMWPSEAAKSGKIPLHLCHRVVPQDSDTGGFFIVLLRKLKESPSVEVVARASLNTRKVADVERELPVGRSVRIAGINRLNKTTGACRAIIAEKSASFGTVKQIHIPEAHHNAPRSYCVVVFATDAEAQQFLAQGDSFIVDGKELGAKLWQHETGGKPDRDAKPLETEEPTQEKEANVKKNASNSRSGGIEPISSLKLPDTEKLAKKISDYYGLESFPFNNCIMRGESTKIERTGKVFLTSEGVNKVLTGHEAHRLRVIIAGVCVFGRDSGQNPDCSHKLSHESLHFTYPYMRKRTVIMDTENFRRLSDEKIVFLDTLPEGSSFRAGLETLGPEPGCFAADLDPDVLKRAGVKSPVVMSSHRGRTRISSLVADKDVDNWMLHVEDILRKAGMDVPGRKGITKEQKIDKQDRPPAAEGGE